MAEASPSLEIEFAKPKKKKKPHHPFGGGWGGGRANSCENIIPEECRSHSNHDGEPGKIPAERRSRSNWEGNMKASATG